MNVVQMQIIIRSKERLASEFVWEKCWVKRKQRKKRIRRRRKSMVSDQSKTQNYQGRPGQKYPTWPDSASVD